jgi:hypothetical protein
VQPDNSTTYSGAIASATDAAGNTIVTGFFWTDSLKFGSYTLYNSVPDGSSNDVFIVKYDSGGTVLWAKQFGSTGYDFPDAITVDKNGNSYVTGGFSSSSIVAGPSMISNHDLTDTTTDMFILKVSSDGNFLWADGFGGDYNDQGNGIGTDASGNVYIGAFYESDSLYVGQTEYYNATLPIKDHNDILIKLDSLGHVLWARNSVDSTGGTETYALSAGQSGSTIMVGRFNGQSVTFGPLTIQNQENGWNDVFVVKYDSAGNVAWAQDAGGHLDDEALAVAADPAGNSYVTGYYNSSTALFGAQQIDNDTTNGSGDIFVAKYDPNGNLLWVNSYGGDENDVAQALALDTNMNIYITGYYFSGQFQFGNTTVTNSDNSGQTDDVFVAVFDKNGNPASAVSTGGLSYDYGSGLSTDISGNLYIAGVFRSDDIAFGATTLDNGSATHNNTPFIAKYGINITTGILTPAPPTDIVLYPNPATGIITINSEACPGHEVTVQIYDLNGSEVVISQLISSDKIVINIGNLVPGMYMAKISEGGSIWMAKFVKMASGQ